MACGQCQGTSCLNAAAFVDKIDREGDSDDEWFDELKCFYATTLLYRNYNAVVTTILLSLKFLSLQTRKKDWEKDREREKEKEWKKREQEKENI